MTEVNELQLISWGLFKINAVQKPTETPRPSYLLTNCNRITIQVTTQFGRKCENSE